MAGADIFFPAGEIGGGVSVPTGVVLPYAAPASSVPAGWVLCDGSAVSRTAYASLYAAIGIAFGAGDGVTTFNLPNLNGRVPIGVSDSHGLASNGGSETHTLTQAETPDARIANGDYGDNIITAAGDNNDGYLNAKSSLTPTTRGIGGNPHSLMQPYLTLNYIIKA